MLSRRASAPSSPIREAGQTNRATIHECEEASARRWSSSASSSGSEAGGKSGAWSIRRWRSSRRATWRRLWPGRPL